MLRYESNTIFFIFDIKNINVKVITNIEVDIFIRYKIMYYSSKYFIIR